VNLLQMVGERQRSEVRNRQEFQHGVVVGYQENLYRVSANGLTYFAESLSPDRFLAGDRVFLVLGRGTPRILGLEGKDVDAI
jgi:hypothetical protein